MGLVPQFDVNRKPSIAINKNWRNDTKFPQPGSNLLKKDIKIINAFYWSMSAISNRMGEKNTMKFKNGRRMAKLHQFDVLIGLALRFEPKSQCNPNGNVKLVSLCIAHIWIPVLLFYFSSQPVLKFLFSIVIPLAFVKYILRKMFTTECRDVHI